MAPSKTSTGRRRMWWCILATFLIGLTPQALRAQDFNACAASPEVKAALDRLRADRAPAQTGKEFSEQRRALIRALASQFPHDFFVERAFIHFRSGTLERTKLIEQYGRRGEGHAARSCLASKSCTSSIRTAPTFNS